jgi:DNA-binding response OmpR family regulator
MSKKSVIIMLTVHAQRNDRHKAFVYGADHPITKPFSPLALVKKVNNCCKNDWRFGSGQ